MARKVVVPITVLLILALCVLGACATAGVKHPRSAQAGYKYICPCGTKCDCRTISDIPGKCPCGKQMMYLKILREDAGNYYFCTACGVNCACLEADKKKNDLCGCGKPLQAFPKRGAFVCSCGTNCNCGTQSNKAGNCPCGKPLAPVKK